MDQGQLDATSQQGSSMCLLRQAAPARWARAARGPILDGGVGAGRRLPWRSCGSQSGVWAGETCSERGAAGLFLSRQVGPDDFYNFLLEIRELLELFHTSDLFFVSFLII